MVWLLTAFWKLPLKHSVLAPRKIVEMMLGMVPMRNTALAASGPTTSAGEIQVLAIWSRAWDCRTHIRLEVIGLVENDAGGAIHWYGKNVGRSSSHTSLRLLAFSKAWIIDGIIWP